VSAALRPYQAKAVEDVRALIRRGARRILVVAPTGAGKTVIASHILSGIVGRKRTGLFVAHRRELILQSYRKTVGCTCSAGYVHDSFMPDPACRGDGLPEGSVGVIMAGDKRRRPTAPIQIASIDTLRNRVKPAADVVFVDECHRALARGYVELQAAYPKAVHLGLTATPYRADGKGLGDAYDEIVIVASPRVLIDEGFLVEPSVWTVPAADLPDLGKVKLKGGDYDEKALAVAVDQGGLVGNIVEHWERHALNVPTVAFAASVAHSKHIAESFVARGHRAEHLDGETPRAERDAILGRLERGEITIVTNCGVLTEGWDQPRVKCCILARPTKSTGLYLQCAGRILRPFEGRGAIILDHAGSVLEHGLPQDDREFSLDAKKKLSAPKAPSCKTCEQCFAIVPTAVRVCPACGFEFPFAESSPELEEAPGELVEVRPATQDEKRAAWDALCKTAEQRGYKPGWAWHQYREKFGMNPPSTFQRPKTARAGTPDEERAVLDVLRAEAQSRGYRPAWVSIRFRARFGHEIPAAWMLPDIESEEVA
jgi:DNA repair protein RadD